MQTLNFKVFFSFFKSEFFFFLLVLIRKRSQMREIKKRWTIFNYNEFNFLNKCLIIVWIIWFSKKAHNVEDRKFKCSDNSIWDALTVKRHFIIEYIHQNRLGPKVSLQVIFFHIFLLAYRCFFCVFLFMFLLW